MNKSINRSYKKESNRNSKLEKYNIGNKNSLVSIYLLEVTEKDVTELEDKINRSFLTEE